MSLFDGKLGSDLMALVVDVREARTRNDIAQHKRVCAQGVATDAMRDLAATEQALANFMSLITNSTGATRTGGVVAS